MLFSNWRIFKKKFQLLSRIFLSSILMFQKPSLGPCDVPHKILARSTQPFWRLSVTNKQTDKQRLYKDANKNIIFPEHDWLIALREFCFQWLKDGYFNTRDVDRWENKNRHFSILFGKISFVTSRLKNTILKKNMLIVLNLVNFRNFKLKMSVFETTFWSFFAYFETQFDERFADIFSQNSIFNNCNWYKKKWTCISSP